jgi:hypothetical protein
MLVTYQPLSFTVLSPQYRALRNFFAPRTFSSSFFCLYSCRVCFSGYARRPTDLRKLSPSHSFLSPTFSAFSTTQICFLWSRFSGLTTKASPVGTGLLLWYLPTFLFFRLTECLTEWIPSARAFID